MHRPVWDLPTRLLDELLGEAAPFFAQQYPLLEKYLCQLNFSTLPPRGIPYIEYRQNERL